MVRTYGNGNYKWKITLIALSTVALLAGCTNSGDKDGRAGEEHHGMMTVQDNNTGNANTTMPWIASKNTTRINHDQLAEAAVTSAQTLWMATSEMNRPGSVIITNPENWQEALVSADLIHHPSNGPILFASSDRIPEITIQELKRLNPTGATDNDNIQAILVGDFTAEVVRQIEKTGFKTDHITAENPASMAEIIDDYYAKVAGELPNSVIIGSMDAKEYTMPAINWISHMPEPLLYVSKTEVPQETATALEKRNGNASIYILGPESVISEQVEVSLASYGKVVRISGNDPYTNAIAFAKYKDEASGFGWGITTPGHNFSFVSQESPDLALASAPFSHLGKHAPLLWTNKDRMPDSVMEYIMSVQPKYKDSPAEGPYNHAILTGTSRSISREAQGEIDAMLEITSVSGEGHGGHGTTSINSENQDKGAQQSDSNEHGGHN